jgi:hypothetical protein
MDSSSVGVYCQGGKPGEASFPRSGSLEIGICVLISADKKVVRIPLYPYRSFSSSNFLHILKSANKNLETS